MKGFGYVWILRVETFLLVKDLLRFLLFIQRWLNHTVFEGFIDVHNTGTTRKCCGKCLTTPWDYVVSVCFFLPMFFLFVSPLGLNKYQKTSNVCDLDILLFSLPRHSMCGIFTYIHPQMSYIPWMRHGWYHFLSMSIMSISNRSNIDPCRSSSKARKLEVKDQVEALLVWMPNKVLDVSIFPLPFKYSK